MITNHDGNENPMFATWHEFNDPILGEGVQTYPQLDANTPGDLPKGPQGYVAKTVDGDWAWYISDEWVEPAGKVFAYGDAETREQAIRDADSALVNASRSS